MACSSPRFNVTRKDFAGAYNDALTAGPYSIKVIAYKVQSEGKASRKNIEDPDLLPDAMRATTVSCMRLPTTAFWQQWSKSGEYGHTFF